MWLYTVNVYMYRLTSAAAFYHGNWRSITIDDFKRCIPTPPPPPSALNFPAKSSNRFWRQKIWGYGTLLERKIVLWSDRFSQIWEKKKCKGSLSLLGPLKNFLEEECTIAAVSSSVCPGAHFTVYVKRKPTRILGIKWTLGALRRVYLSWMKIHTY